MPTYQSKNTASYRTRGREALYLLQEGGGKIILEGGSGFLMIEDDPSTYSNQSKNNSSHSNQSKSNASYSNQSKNNASYANQSKS